MFDTVFLYEIEKNSMKADPNNNISPCLLDMQEENKRKQEPGQMEQPQHQLLNHI